MSYKPKLLHIAPEPSIMLRFGKARNIEYITADLNSNIADIKMDITSIDYPDDYFDYIYCSHVLEHIDNDEDAISELRRVLSPNGWAVIQVPIVGEHTHEDPKIKSPEARFKAFGQHDHVRVYGRDFIERLTSSGFKVQMQTVENLYGDDIAWRHGLNASSGEIFYCRT